MGGTVRPASTLRSWLSKGEWAVAAGGLLLALDLVLLPWHRIRIGLGGTGRISIDKLAVESPNAGYGIAALFVAGLLVTIVASRVGSSRRRRYTSTELRVLRAGAGLACGLLMAKLLVNTDFLGPGSWLAVALSGVVAYGSLLLTSEQARPSDPPSPVG